MAAVKALKIVLKTESKLTQNCAKLSLSQY